MYMLKSLVDFKVTWKILTTLRPNYCFLSQIAVAIGNPERHICAKLRTVTASNNRFHMP